jgi:hypothetical protein
MSSEAFIGIVGCVVALVLGLLFGCVIADAQTRKQCDAFGKAFLNDKVYVCTKQ